ncbi:galactokinase isoform X2 [Lampetra fluviatilis]
MGDHIDYNLGGVLPAALPLVTVMVGGQSGDDSVTVVSMATGIGQSEASFLVPTPSRPLTPGGEGPHWANYVKGVVQGYPVRPLPGFCAVVISSVPLGSGLSSSAALEVATYSFLQGLCPDAESLTLTERASICQRAEAEFAGVPCGVMDQFVSFMARPGHALHIDCRSLQAVAVEVSGVVSLLVMDTGVRHALTSGEYAVRRAQCCEGAALLGVSSLRDATLAMLEGLGERLGERLVRRVRHVLTEMRRVDVTVAALRERDFVKVGQLMAESHASLRDDYEVSCPEADQLVRLSSACPGVLGARITGGGFGGCVVAMVTGDTRQEEEENLQGLVRHVQEHYSGQAKFYRAEPSGGAHTLHL